MKEANKTNPCPHCGKPDWCYSLDNLSVCKRDAEPAQGWYKTTKCDSEGTYYYAVEQPKKKARPKGTRYWVYTEAFTKKPLVMVCRTDDGEGGKPQRWQERWNEKTKKWVKGLTGISRDDISVYRYHEVRQAIKDKKPIFIVEGEPCADALWNLGLAATTNIGGSGKWQETDTNDLAGAEQIILCPDRDKPGLKHMEEIAENFPAAKWLYAYPDSPFWEPGRISESKGLDVADWIEDFNLTADDILKAVEPKRTFDTQPDPKPDEPELKFNSKLNKKLHQIECRLGNHLSYNEFKKRIEIDYQPISDDLNDQGGAKLFIAETLDLDIGDSDAVAILNRVAKKQPYHPVRDYLEECYSRYGTDTTILESIALRYFGASEPIHQTYIIKHLIGSVKRVFEPGCKYDSMLILKGEQGAKKSTWLRTLYGDENFTDSVLGTEEKDSLMALSQYWACEYSEFETISTKKDVSQLKSWLARNRDDYRAPYAKTVKSHPRTFVLVGSTNRDDFLKDETGSRRFMIIPVERDIPIEQLVEERDRIWGAAVSLYRAGVASYLSSVEMKLQKIINEDYTQIDPWSDIIAAYLVNETREFIPTCHLLEKAIGLEANQMGTQESKRVAAIMLQFGFKRQRRRVNGILQWGFVTVPDDDHKIADDLEQAVIRTQQEVQQADPVVPQEDTVETCVNWVKSAIAENDPETAGHIKVVLQDICTEKPEFRSAIWENLDTEEREVFKQLTAENAAKAISFWEPWGTLVKLGLKKFETRSWSTDYRGKLVIQVAQKQDKYLKDACESLCRKLGIELNYDELPFGMAIAVCELTDCVEMTEEFISQQSETEIQCGDWQPGRFAWKLENVQSISPVPMKGKQGLWNVDLADLVEENAIATPAYKVGDSIIINKKHKVSAGKHYLIAEVQENGWVMCGQGTVGALFHEEFFSVLIPEKTVLKALKHKDHDFWNKPTLNQGKLEAVIQKDGKFWARVTCKRGFEMFNLEAVEVVK